VAGSAVLGKAADFGFVVLDAAAVAAAIGKVGFVRRQAAPEGFVGRQGSPAAPVGIFSSCSRTGAVVRSSAALQFAALELGREAVETLPNGAHTPRRCGSSSSGWRPSGAEPLGRESCAARGQAGDIAASFLLWSW
jgi:hypothetical protein